MSDPNANPFDKLIEAFKVLLGIAKADPADKQEIKRLKIELDAKSSEVAILRAKAPTEEQTATLGALFTEFVQAVTPEVLPEDKPSMGSEGIRIAQSVFDARDFFSVPRGTDEKLRCIDLGREADVDTLEAAEAFFAAGSVPPVGGGAGESEGAKPPADEPVSETNESSEAAPSTDDPALPPPPVAANNQPPPAE